MLCNELLYLYNAQCIEKTNQKAPLKAPRRVREAPPTIPRRKDFAQVMAERRRLEVL